MNLDPDGYWDNAQQGKIDYTTNRDKALLRELQMQTKMMVNHKAMRAAQDGYTTIDDLFLSQVPREKYETLMELAIEALNARQLSDTASKT